MKKKKIGGIIALLALILALQSIPPQAAAGKAIIVAPTTNLVPNGGFEGVNHEGKRWAPVGNVTTDLSNDAYEGSWAAHVVQLGGPPGGGLAHDVGAGISPDFPVVGGQNLVCSWAISYILTHAAINLTVNTYRSDGYYDGNFPLMTVFDVSNSGYTVYTATNMMPTDAITANVQLDVGTDDQNGPYYDVLFDAVSCSQ